MNRRRAGFTLTELLIVIAILLVLGTISLAVYNTGKSSDRMRSGARVAQSAILGAKDRAMHAKTFRGVRVMRDGNGPTFIVGGSSNGIYCLATGFVFTQPIDPQIYPAGTIQLERADTDTNGSADSPEAYILRGFDANSPGAPPGVPYVNWYTFASAGSALFNNPGRIRIPAGTGQWYQYYYTTGGQYGLANGNEVLQLATPYVGTAQVPYVGPPPPPHPHNDVVAFPLSVTTGLSCEIQLGNEVLPFHQPMALPAGVVIDLRFCSENVRQAAGAYSAAGATTQNLDLTFSPRGSIAGAAGGGGAIYFCLRDIYDATAGLNPCDPTCKGDCLILALNPSTGLVQTYDADLTDAYNNSTGNPGQDGLVDNLFSFAQKGKAAGR